MVLSIGRKYTDKVTGFTGLATSRTEHLHGSTQFYLEAEALSDGKRLSGWFYASQLREADPVEADESPAPDDAPPPPACPTQQGPAA